MSRLADFFKETHTALGVFYPLHCLVAGFPSLDAAREVARNLENKGFGKDNTITVAGAELVELEKEETGLGSYLMQKLSRFIGGEQISTDHNLEFADRGAGFVVVHCRSEKEKEEAWNVMRPFKPLIAHYYTRGSVDHLAGGFSTN